MGARRMKATGPGSKLVPYTPGVLLVFVDGIGFGGVGPENPFVDLGGEILGALGWRSPRLSRGLALGQTDAGLGVAGVPQSATGQATIFTGVNAAELVGTHLWAFPNARLRALLADKSVLKIAKERGHRVAFLNPFPPHYLEERPVGRIGCSTWAAVASGEPLRTGEDLALERAVSFDATGEFVRARGWPAPLRTAREAGRIAVRASREVDLALWETFLTDWAGHSRDMTWARHEVRRLREVLEGMLEELRPDEHLCLTSDHGNLEDLSTRGHTTHPVPTLWAGPGAAGLAARCRSLTDITPVILNLLESRAVEALGPARGTRPEEPPTP